MAAADLRPALREFRRRPAFAVAALLAFTLGIAAMAAAFTILHAVLLRPLPYEDPGALVEVYQALVPDPDAGEVPVSPATFLDWRAESRSFEDMAIYQVANVNLAGDTPAERLRAVRVSANLFPLLGARSFLGRGLGPGDDRPGQERVVVLAEAFWRTRFGSDPAIVGRTIRLDGEPHVVIGIMPPHFVFPVRWGHGQVWLPLVLTPTERQDRDTRDYSVIARLRAGVDRVQAQVEMHEIGRHLQQRHDEQNQGLFVRVRAAGDPGPSVRRILLIPIVGALGVLLTACANVAALFLARGAARQREVAVRAALGAGFGRLMGLVTLEVLVHSVMGGLIAVGLLGVALPVLAGAMPSWLLPGADDLRLDWPAVAFALGLSLLAGLLAAILPAFRAATIRVQPLLGQVGLTPARHRAMHVLIALQITAVLVVLSAVGLLLKNVAGAVYADPGFDSARLLTMRISLAPGTYRERGEWDAFFIRARAEFAAVAGVEGAVFGQSVPGASRGDTVSLRIPDRPASGPGGFAGADYVRVDAGYHELLGIPLRRGRHLDDGDAAGAPRVAIVNEAFVRRYLGDTDALGRRVFVSALYGELRRTADFTELTIVGVVGDTREHALAPEAPIVYVPARQDPAREMFLCVRVSGDPSDVVTALRHQLRRIDPDQAIWQVRTIGQIYADNLALHRFHLWLLGGFGAMAFLLAGLGVFSVMACWVLERTREFGVRAALGASPRDLVRMVIRRILRVTAAGLAAGSLAAWALARVARSSWDLSWFFAQGAETGISFDPAVAAVAAALLVSAALLAGFLPARRAARADPISALRHQ